MVQLAGPSGIARSSTGDAAAPSLADQGFVTLPVPAGMTQAEYLAALDADPAIVSAMPDAPVYAAADPDDPLYSSYQQSYLTSIGAPAAWDYATGNGEIIVAVLDTGVDTNHPELKDRLWVNTAEVPGDGVDNDGNGCIDDVHGCRFVNVTPERMSECGYTAGSPRGVVRDDHGKPGSGQHSHGTLVAGVLAAAGNNGIGISGMAWNVRVMVVKVLDCGLTSNGGAPGGNMSNVAEGIDYARRMGAHIINLSLSSDPGEISADTPALRRAIEDAQQAGIIIVAAAGNHEPGATKVAPGYPAAYTNYPAVVGVGASNAAAGNSWENYSNYGTGVDFAAPGRDIAGPTRTDLGGSSYGADRGTSFAAPLVSGMFALMMSRNDRLSVASYLQIATETATAAPPAAHGGNWAGAGIINAGAAIAHVPMLITGAALHDWKDVPAATPIRALIDGVECGSTTTSAVGPQARYTLRVWTDAEMPGCGAPGRTVTLTIGGLPATPTFTWAGLNGDLGLPNRDITSQTAPPGGIIVQELSDGWNMVAQLEPGGSLPAALNYLPGEWSEAAAWGPELNRYRQYTHGAPAYVNTLSAISMYDALWVRTTAGNTAVINPLPGPREVALQAGWNPILYTGISKPVSVALADIAGKYTAVMQFDNLARNWQIYLPTQPRYINDFGGLLQMRIYWVYVTEAVTIVME